MKKACKPLGLSAVALLVSLHTFAQAELPGAGYAFEGNGKRPFPCQANYLPATLPTGSWQLSDAVVEAANEQLSRSNKNWSGDGFSISQERLTETLSWLADGARSTDRLKVRALHGEDGCGNTHFTGYYTPLLDVKASPDAEYRYPFYQLPKQWPGGKKLTRRQIDIDHKLAGQGLELAYSRDPISNYFVSVQGSARVRYVDTGQERTLAYGGKNGSTYWSLGKHLVASGEIDAREISLDSIRAYLRSHPNSRDELMARNPSYTFYRDTLRGPFAASGAQVTPMVTAAVDTRYIPHGAVLLAEIPQIDSNSKVTGYKLQLLVAQDRGAAIKGAGHVDIYMGTGKQAERKASALHHYGRLWWLMVGR